MTRYEMASVVAKAMQKKDISFGDKAVLDKLSAEYAGELDTLNKKVDANTKAIKDLNKKTDKFKVWGMTRLQMVPTMPARSCSGKRRKAAPR